MESYSTKRGALNPHTYPVTIIPPRERTVSRPRSATLRWREPLLIFAGWRILLLLLPFVAALVAEAGKHGGTAPFHVVSYYEGTTDFWTDRLFAAWGRWDGEWYLQIMNFGYTPVEGAPAFFPLYPLLARLAGDLLGANYLVGGVLVSTVASALAFVLFYNLTRRDFGNRRLAQQATLNFALFPTAFFLTAIYTEAVFMALALAAFYIARHVQSPTKWWWVGLLVGLAALTRNVGVLLLAGLLWEWWRQNRPEGQWWRLSRAALGSLIGLTTLPGLALAGWLGANWVVLGDPLLFMKAQNSRFWERRSAMPWETIWRGFSELFSLNTFSDSKLVDFATFIIWVGLVGAGVWLVRRRQYPLSYLIFLVIAFLPGLCQPRINEPLFAIPRYLLVLFPAYQIIALILPQSRWARLAYGLFSLIGLCYLTIHFVQWGWVA